MPKDVYICSTKKNEIEEKWGTLEECQNITWKIREKIGVTPESHYHKKICHLTMYYRWSIRTSKFKFGKHVIEWRHLHSRRIRMFDIEARQTTNNLSTEELSVIIKIEQHKVCYSIRWVFFQFWTGIILKFCSSRILASFPQHNQLPYPSNTYTWVSSSCDSCIN